VINVSIYCCDSIFSTLSAKGGKYSIKVPDSAKTLTFSLQNYQQKILDIPKKIYPSPIKINLKPYQETDYGKRLKKNVLAFAPLELINHKFTLLYERFINQGNSVGIFSDIYINSNSLLFENTSI